MSKFNSKTIFLSTAISLSFGAAAWAGYSQYKHSQLKTVYKSLCSNTVIQWAKSFGNLKDPQITFGPEQSKMMSELNAYTREYIDKGVDRLKDVQIAWAESYVPGYMRACVSYNLEESANCHKLPQDQFMDCAKSVDENYQAMIQARIVEAGTIEKKPWDLATTNLEVMKRSLRRFQAGELFPSAAEAMSTANAMPSENTFEQMGRMSDSWAPLLSATRELKKLVSEKPENLKNADSETLDTLTKSVSDMMNALPSELESLKPQLENLRDSIRAKNPELVIQYCDYLEEQHKRQTASVQ